MSKLRRLVYRLLRSSTDAASGEQPAVHYPLRTTAAWIWTEMKHNRLQAFLNTFVGVTLVLLDLLFVWLTKLTIDIATGQEQRLTITAAGLLLIVTILIQIALSFFSRWIRAILGVKALNEMQRRLFAHILMSRWSGMEKYHSGDILNRIEKDVSSIVSFVTESLPSLITVIVQFSGAFIFLFLMDKILACAVVILLPFFVLISKIYIKKMRELTHSVRKTDSQVQALIQESLQHRTVVKALEQAGAIISRLSSVQMRMSRQVRSRTKYSSISAAIMNVGFAAGYLFAFLWGATQLQQGVITYGALIAFIQLVGQIQGPARSLTGYIPVFISTITSSERLMELEDIPRESIPRESKPFSGIAGITIQDVSYRYSPEKPILRHLSFQFPPGSSTAIIGETGAGKTTLIRLMLGLIRPQEGIVGLYDDKATSVANASTRCNFAYVPQGNTLFSGSIRRNLLFGCPDATEAEMKEALGWACADFVRDLPEGIDTVCGEQGYGLSEGQAQRICIARALLRRGSIILLDEATSALDGTTELKVLENIRTQFPHKTLIMVSHREAALRFCDQTLTLERKRKR
jgi:ATP-binding cassette subfamily B protein